MASQKNHDLAAEKALGLEPVEAETRKEAELRQQWERYFAPLGLALPDVRPPDDIWYRVQASLDRADDRRAIRRTRGKLWRWRFATVVMAGTAAALAGLLFMQTLDPKAPDGLARQYVAVITPEDATSAVIVEVDLEAGIARLRPVGVSAPEGKALQVWTARPEGDPRPVGLLDTGSVNTFEVSAEPGDAFAVSVEPEGGSPTGSPTGEVVYHGTLIAVPD